MKGRTRKSDQERTLIGKRAFLGIFMEEHCIIRHCCARIGIHWTTFYRWKRQDQRFIKKMDNVFEKGMARHRIQN